MSIMCIHGLEQSACNQCRPARPMPKPVRKPRASKPKPAEPNLFDAEAQHRLELAMQSARQAAHAGTLLSKQLGKRPQPLAPIKMATNG